MADIQASTEKWVAAFIQNNEDEDLEDAAAVYICGDETLERKSIAKDKIRNSAMDCPPSSFFIYLDDVQSALDKWNANHVMMVSYTLQSAEFLSPKEDEEKAEYKGFIANIIVDDLTGHIKAAPLAIRRARLQERCVLLFWDDSTSVSLTPLNSEIQSVHTGPVHAFRLVMQ